MNRIKLVYKRDNQSEQNQTKDFTNRINLAKNESDLTKIASDLNKYLKSETLSISDKNTLKSIRQKIYDKNKRINIRNKKINMSDKKVTSTSDFQILSDLNKSEANLTTSENIKNHKDSFHQIKFFQNLDLINLIKYLGSISVFSLCALVTMWFIWKQSIPLYEAVGFTDPKFCAIGAIIMIVGFAIIHSLTKSKIVLFLCLYASTYEVFLITSGTLTDDSAKITVSIENNEEFLWLKEKAVHSQIAYQDAKSKFDDPSSKVFQNSWYNEKYVVPAWNQYAFDQNTMIQKQNQLKIEAQSTKNNSILKILFRLGLVFLCMISIHNLLKILNLNSIFKQKNSHSDAKSVFSII